MELLGHIADVDDVSVLAAVAQKFDGAAVFDFTQYAF
ncbi:hypothetical protein SDC9_186015 [bioreactor metagenome]|uniref:Uncharacterized protein n=1 Tax=bioreactor metagenome TaxID=1076179 RepID=A0A645HHJ1_9ZZZZ